MPGWEDALCTGICMSKGNFNRADRYIALMSQGPKRARLFS